jgi:glycosyltransferase involved in cell wall biosynthesis
MDGSYAFAFEDHPSPFKKWVVGQLFSLRNILLRQADAFLSISRVISEELRQAGVEQNKIIHFGAAVDIERFSTILGPEKSELRQRLELPQKYLFIYSGRLAKGKGLSHLAEAWRKLYAKNSDIALLLVGSAQGHKLDYEAELRDFFIQHQLENSVHFIGEVGNIEEYLQAADCFVFPTENEALGNSLMEACSVGLAVVASNVGGVPDVVDDGVNGILVEPGDASALYNAMHAMESDRVRANELGNAASQKIRTHFSVENKMEILEELLKAKPES